MTAIYSRLFMGGLSGIIKFITGLLLIFLLVLSVWLIQGDGPRSIQRLILAETAQPVFALLYIAEAKGFFDEIGLEITFLSFDSSWEAMQSVVDRQADIAAAHETSVVLQSYAGEPLGIISTLHYSKRNTGLVVRKDHGIHTPQDLTGTRLAIAENSNGQFFFSLYLISQGIASSDVTTVNADPEDLVFLFKSGRVDGIVTENPILYKAQISLANDKVKTFYSDVHTEMSLLVGMRETILGKKDAITRLLKGIVRAEEFMHSHQEEAIQIVIERLSSYDEDILRNVWGVFTPVAMLNNVLPLILRQEAQWFINIGRFQAPPPEFNNIIMTEYLSALKPKSVTVF